MRFHDWMTRTRSSNAAFGKEVGTSGETIRRYRLRLREPDAAMQAKIFHATDGEVTPNDWVGVGPVASEPEIVSEQVLS